MLGLFLCSSITPNSTRPPLDRTILLLLRLLTRPLHHGRAPERRPRHQRPGPPLELRGGGPAPPAGQRGALPLPHPQRRARRALRAHPRRGQHAPRRGRLRRLPRDRHHPPRAGLVDLRARLVAVRLPRQHAAGHGLAAPGPGRGAPAPRARAPLARRPRPGLGRARGLPQPRELHRRRGLAAVWAGPDVHVALCHGPRLAVARHEPGLAIPDSARRLAA